MTMIFQLGGHSEAFVQGQFDSGRYSDATDVVREALRLMEERAQVKADIREKIEAGWQDIQAGRMSDGDALMQSLMAGLDDA